MQFNQLNTAQELKNINLILKHNNANRKKQFSYELVPGFNHDIILYRKVLRSLKTLDAIWKINLDTGTIIIKFKSNNLRDYNGIFHLEPLERIE
jgi:hypothetical protein